MYEGLKVQHITAFRVCECKIRTKIIRWKNEWFCRRPSLPFYFYSDRSYQYTNQNLPYM